MAKFAPIYMTVYDGNVTLVDLVLSNDEVDISDGEADPGDVVGVISGQQTGSTLSLTGTDAARFAIVGSNLTVGGSALTADTYDINIRETNPDASNEDEYHETAFTITAVA